MRLSLFSRPERWTVVYDQAAQAALGSPGRKATTALAVAFAHDIAWSAAQAGPSRPGLDGADAALARLAERYGLAPAAVQAERARLRSGAAVQPAQAPRSRGARPAGKARVAH